MIAFTFPPLAKTIRRSSIATVAFATIVCVQFALGASDKTSYKFDFSSGPMKAAYTRVTPTTTYSAQGGYGFEPGASVKSVKEGTTSDQPFFFSVALPEGNYNVTAVFGGKEESTTTVKAELRRLMLEKIHVQADKSVEKSFIVNIRTPAISTGGEVHLKDREKTSEWRAWDEKMTLEFNGKNPSLISLDIEKVDVPTFYIMGDSTVCDQPAEPWNSWGQMLPRFFKPQIAISNHAESGETVAGSLHALRFEKIFNSMKAGDYLFVQFGHNDMKNHAPDALETYKSDLQKIVARTRSLGGTPVLVTSMERKGGVEHDTLNGYPDAVSEVAASEKCGLIDLHAMSRIFYKALGGDIGKAFQDGTHHNNYGSYELAKCIVEGIKNDKLPLAKFIVDDFGDFDPAKPDAVATFEMAVSPNASKEKPLGN